MASTAASELLVDLLNDAMLVDTEKEKLEMVHEMQVRVHDAAPSGRGSRHRPRR